MIESIGIFLTLLHAVSVCLQIIQKCPRPAQGHVFFGLAKPCSTLYSSHQARPTCGDTNQEIPARNAPYFLQLDLMSGHVASGGGSSSGKVTLTLWVHDSSQAPGTQQQQQQTSTTSEKAGYGVPLANTLSSEIVLSPELLKNELLDLQIGDVVELIKASNANGASNNGGNNSQGAGSGSTTSSWNGTITHQERYKRHHRQSGRRSSALSGPRTLPDAESLVFRIERSSLANEGSSGQLQVCDYLSPILLSPLYLH